MNDLIHNKLLTLGEEAEASAEIYLKRAESAALTNTARVLSAFRRHRVSDSLFAGTTGYGYNDAGRDTLDRVYADAFFAESALVRVQFVNGTHAIASAMYACLEPGRRLLCATGLPYDTLQGVVGIGQNPPRHGTLAAYGCPCTVVPMKDGQPNYEAISDAIRAYADIGAVEIQRSRGYADRVALSVEEIGRIAELVHKHNPAIHVVVDNCYGEFVETTEPCAVGADLMAGSLIKNPGGGLALCGGYVAGRAGLVERAAERLTVPGIGGECGSSLGQNRSLFQGFFLAPHVTAQALKTAIFASALFQRLGYTVDPLPGELRHDIIQTIKLESPEPLIAFMRGVQAGAPIDAFAIPEPCDIPGYDDPVVMAAGAFVQGSSIELSADAPMRAPYTAYLQGGLTYEAGKLGVLLAAQEISKL
ncbi:MAG: methionine gamma-lyase family protein [Clostridiaceae bacterium]|nr:methionine gamma-lyase family protein [Clostridiaceae bacterium]